MKMITHLLLTVLTLWTTVAGECPSDDKDGCFRECRELKTYAMLTSCLEMCDNLCPRHESNERRKLLQDPARDAQQSSAAGNMCMANQMKSLAERVEEFQVIVDTIAGPALGDHVVVKQLRHDLDTLEQHVRQTFTDRVFLPTEEPTFRPTLASFGWSPPEGGAQATTIDHNGKRLDYSGPNGTWFTYRTDTWIDSPMGKTVQTIKIECSGECLFMIGVVGRTYTRYNSNMNDACWTWYVHPGSHDRHIYAPKGGAYQGNGCGINCWENNDAAFIHDGDYMTITIDPAQKYIGLDWSRNNDWDAKFINIPQAEFDAGMAFGVSPHTTGNKFTLCPPGDKTC